MYTLHASFWNVKNGVTITISNSLITANSNIVSVLGQFHSTVFSWLWVNFPAALRVWSPSRRRDSHLVGRWIFRYFCKPSRALFSEVNSGTVWPFRSCFQDPSGRRGTVLSPGRAVCHLRSGSVLGLRPPPAARHRAVLSRADGSKQAPCMSGTVNSCCQADPLPSLRGLCLISVYA